MIIAYQIKQGARFRLMADAAPVLIWASGPDKACTYFNEPWLEFTGRPIEQELGAGLEEVAEAGKELVRFKVGQHSETCDDPGSTELPEEEQRREITGRGEIADDGPDWSGGRFPRYGSVSRQSA